MKANDRIVVNTAAQYIRTIINVALSMYSTRLVLALLGETDFGVYNLVAGVVAMLSFISNALVVSTQRFLSFYQGKGDMGKLKSIFNDSLVLHIGLGALLLAVMLSLLPLLFNGFLEIPAARVDAARYVYVVVVCVLFVTLVTAPFRALLISHEDIVYISAVDIIDGVLKVALVVLLAHMDVDKLTGYARMLAYIQLFNFFALSIFSYIRYEECVRPRLRSVSGAYIRELGSFAGWTIYSTGCIVGRTEGVSVLLDKFVGVVACGAFGIAKQVSGFVSFVSESLLNAIRPQIMKAEGEQNRERMLALSCKAGKVSFLLLACVSLPVLFYIEPLLVIWLKDVPENAPFYCRMVLLASLMDVTTIGLASANQAIGNIRNYSLAVNTTKVLTLPLVWLALHYGASLFWVAASFVGVELLCAMIRLPFLKITAGLDVKAYARGVLLPLLLPSLVYAGLLFVCRDVLHLGFIAAGFICVAVYGVTVYFCALDRSERSFINGYAARLRKR